MNDKQQDDEAMAKKHDSATQSFESSNLENYISSSQNLNMVKVWNSILLPALTFCIGRQPYLTHASFFNGMCPHLLAYN